MKVKKLVLSIAIISVTVMLLSISGFTDELSDNEFTWDEEGCIDIMAGKDATVDGSVLTSQTCDGGYDSRLIIIPAADHEPGTMAPVYKGIIRAAPEFPNRDPLVKLGEIPEVAHTYKIFKIAYPIANDQGVIVGETTLGNETECTSNKDTAIMYIEQLQIFGLQRATTAREFIEIVGELAEKWGYVDRGECLNVADENEVWVLEIYPVGPLWTPESGKPGAVWAAQRVPDDHIATVPNKSVIWEIDPSDTKNFMVSSNYKECAIELGLYDPASGEPFIWRFTYRDRRKRAGTDRRTWRVFNLLASKSGPWLWTERSHYPFSIKPDKKVSYKDFIAVFQDEMIGTEYDNTEDQAWYVKARRGEHAGEMVKSSLASPEPSRARQTLLNIYSLDIASGKSCSYYFVSQSRDWLPNEIGDVFWFGLDDPKTGVFIPVYVGNTEVPESWTVLDRTKFDRKSAWWAFAKIDDQVNDLYGFLNPKLDEVLIPMQEEMYAKQESIEQEALKLYKNDPESAIKFLTDYTYSLMEKTEQVYWDLFESFLFETNNNHLRLDY